MTKKPKRKFTEAFKREALKKMELRGSRSVEEVASILDVAPAMLYQWRLQYGSQIAGSDAETEAMELKRLRRENETLKRERDILKKFAVFLAKESG